MTAEAVVCSGAVSEVAGTEEEREFKARSLQDFAKSELDGIGNHDQIDDPEDSYVLVTDVGDLGADGKDMAAVDGSHRHESSAPGELIGTELNVPDRNLEGADVGKHGTVEAGDVAKDGSPQHEPSAPGELLGTELNAPNGNPEGANVGKHTLVNGSPDVQVISIVDGAGNQGYTVEEENKCSEELNDQNGKLDVIVDGGGNQDNTVEEENTCSEQLNDQNGKIDVIVDGGGKQDNTVEEENTCLEHLNDQNGKIDVIVDGEGDPTLREGGIGNTGSTDENPSVADGVLVGAEGSVRNEDEIQDKLATTLREEGIGNAGSTDENISVADGVLVGVEGTLRDEDEIQDKLAVSKPECEAEFETEKAEDSDGKIERAEEAEVAKFEGQNGTIGVVAMAEPDSVQEIQESEVPNLALVADSGEEDEPKNLLSPYDKQETVEDEAESALCKEGIQNQKCDINPENDIQYGLDKDKVVESAADCNVVTAYGEVLEGKDERVSSVSHVQGSIMCPDGAVNSRDGYGAACQISVSEREAESFGPTQKQSAVLKPENEVQISDSETVISSLPVDGSESESFGNEPIHLDCLEISGGSVSPIRADVSNETISQGSELNVDTEDDRNPAISAVKLEPEAHNSSVADHIAVTSEEDATNGSEVLDSIASDEGVSNPMLESADIKAVVGGATGSDEETLLLAKNGDTGNSCSIDISKASPESSSDTVTKEDVSGVAVTKPFNFFVRTPRYSDEKLQEQIRIQELEVDDKTKLRDSIQAQIQEIRAKNQNISINYEYAKGEDRSLKKLLKEKRMEIDSLQSVINKAKNATSIEDLNNRIKNIEHIIQHETLPLKEEKQLIHEIKQWKQLREQLSSSKCSQNEIQQALEQREQAEERVKTLRKELGNLKGITSKAQTACDEAESKFSVEHKKVKELQAQFRAADDARQEAYAKLLRLSKELSQKRKNFFKFKNDSATATYYAFTDDRKNLYRHCVNEVEKFMELWNGNAEFRSEYVRLNTRSTLRRFCTLDGRSLGPDEKPTILPSYVSERNDKLVSAPANADPISKTPTIELKPETKIENVHSDIHLSKKETESKVKTVTIGGPAKSKQVNSLVTVSGMDDEKVEVQEEPVKTKEELELIRKAEEIRREEAEAKLKEQRRLEEIVKAKEARERKQRLDEKAQKREELKARKEAEQKEKEREKKSRKKERRKAASTSTSAPMDVQDDASSITCVEISKEETSTQVSDVSTKKHKTSRVMVSKQNKTRSVPPPSLRHRNRRKWQQWMWVILISLAVLVLFWLGNLGVFSGVNSKLQGNAGF